MMLRCTLEAARRNNFAAFISASARPYGGT